MAIGGVGEATRLSSATVPEVPVRIGGLDVCFRPARVLLQETDAASRKFHGLPGLPVLSLARCITLDFEALLLRLE